MGTVFDLEPHNKRGRVAPLFDRLIDADPICELEHPHFMHLKEDQLIQSIEVELEYLLGTRLGMRRELYEQRTLAYDPSVLLYGVPDFSVSLLRGKQNIYLNQVLEGIISNFEPRIHDVQVRCTAGTVRSDELDIHIEGTIYVGGNHLPVQFHYTQ